MRQRLYRALPALVGLGLFIIALEVLRRQLKTLSWPALLADVLSTPTDRLIAAVAFVILNYAILTGYDFIALAYIGKRLPAWRVVLTSFTAYAVANNVGFAILSGASVRYRFYSRLGITAQELSRIVFSGTVTFWLGIFTLGGLTLALSPPPSIEGLPGGLFLAQSGWLLAAVAPAYLILTVVRRAPLRLRGLELPLPPLKLAVAQVVVSAADWALAAAALFKLLPPNSAPFVKVMGAFLGAQLLGLASHIPGSIGVFESMMVLLLDPFMSSDHILPSLVVFRVIYYLLPLSVAMVGLIVDEIRQRRSHAIKITSYLLALTRQLTPKVLAVITFIGGLVLLFSGATPAAEGRLAFLDRFLPLGVLETSHFLGSLAGVALLLLSQGLARRLDAAYWLAVLVTAVGIVTSLLKGGGYEEAVILTVLLVLLATTRRAFNRNAAFFETRFSASWIVAVIAAVTSSVWLGFFAFRHVEYSSDLWWQFELHAEASRFLRATVGASIALMFFAVARLMGYAPHEAPEPTADDLEVAGEIIRRQKETYPNLLYLRDKAILFDKDRTGFVMYGVQGRTSVVLGDPVCPGGRIPDFIRLFVERCDDFGTTPVFYEVRKENLHHYVDFGLNFIKLGEEAKVDLQAFSLEGSSASRLRQAVRKLDKEGVSFRVLTPEEAIPRMDELQGVSDDWLSEKTGGEKGFSLGFFDRRYLSMFPIAVIEREGRILAFANLWPGSEKHQLSADLMRYHRDAPKGIMESLFVCLIVWGKEQGYARFSLGMAPMSGFEQSPIAPLWTKVGIFLYEHGEPFYNFQGLRAFKEKFSPVWESRYLASPGGFKLPLILADVAALVAGGYRRVLLK
jgi:phosphatidylglycerol lysyltransferase